MKAVALPWLLIILALAACSGNATPDAHPSESETPTTTTIAPQRPGENPMPSPTMTATHARTPTSRLPTRTPQPTATLFDPFSPVALETVVARQPEVTVHRSPDGVWRAERLVYGCLLMGEFNEVSVMELHVVNAITDERFPIAEQVISCGGLGAYGLAVLYWSPNGRYLYYTDAAFGAPDGLACYWSPGMYRFDLNDWNNLGLAYGSSGPAPNLLTLRYDDRLVFWYLDRGEIGEVAGLLEDFPIGGFAWAEDGQKLAYLQTESACSPYGDSAIVLLNWPSLSQKLAPEWPGAVRFVWDAPYRLHLTDEAGQQWHFNIAMETLRQIE
jgi:hypothetical protein